MYEWQLARARHRFSSYEVTIGMPRMVEDAFLVELF